MSTPTDKQPNFLMLYAEALDEKKEYLMDQTYVKDSGIMPIIYATKEPMIRDYPDHFHIREELTPETLKKYSSVLRFNARMAFLAFKSVKAFLAYRDTYPFNERYFDELFTSDDIFPVFDIEKTIENDDMDNPIVINFNEHKYINTIKSAFIDVIKNNIWKKDATHIKNPDNIKWFQCNKTRKTSNGVKISFHLGIKNLTINRKAFIKLVARLKHFINDECVEHSVIFKDCIKAVGCRTIGKDNIKLMPFGDFAHDIYYFSTVRDNIYGTWRTDTRKINVHKKFSQRAQRALNKVKIANETMAGDVNAFNKYVADLLSILSDDKTTYNDRVKWSRVGFALGSLKNGDRNTLLALYLKFSSQSKKYNEVESIHTFNTSNGNISIGSIIYMAKSINPVKFNSLTNPTVLKKEKKDANKFIKNLTKLEPWARSLLSKHSDSIKWTPENLNAMGYNYVRQDSRYVQSYTVHATNIIRAIKGNGKTHSLPGIINEKKFKCAVVVFHRQTLGLQLTKDLSRSNYPFRFYNEPDLKDKKEFDLREYPYLCIQAESLYKIKNLELVELFLCDEFRSLEQQFYSPTMKKIKITFNRFERLLTNAPYFIALDADFETLDLAIIAKYRDIKTTQIIDNVYNLTNRPRHSYFTQNTGYMLKKLIIDIKAGLSVVINCVRALEVVMSLSEMLGEAKQEFIDNCLIITADTKNNPKVKAACDNTECPINGFGAYKYLIYTPTIESGVSFNPKHKDGTPAPHFDKFYGFYYTMSDIPRLEQGTSRIRELKANEYNYAFYLDKAPRPLTSAEFDKWVIVNKVKWKFAIDMITTDISITGEDVEYPIKSNYYDLYKNCKLREANDLNNFLVNWLSYKYRNGFRKFTYIDVSDFTDEESKEYLELENDLKRRKCDKQRAKTEDIRTSDDITESTAKTIIKNMEAEETVDKKQVNQLLKYNIVNKLYTLDFDIKEVREVDVSYPPPDMKGWKEKDLILTTVDASKIIFTHAQNRASAYKTLSEIIKCNRDITDGLNIVDDRDKSSMLGLLLNDVKDVKGVNHYIELAGLKIKPLTDESDEKTIDKTKMAIYSDINKFNYFNDAGKERTDIKNNEILKKIVFKSRVNKFILAFETFKRLGFNDMLDTREINGDALKAVVYDMYKKGAVEKFVKNMSMLTANPRMYTRFKKWKTDAETVFKAFMNIFNDPLRMLGIALRSKRVNVKGHKTNVYRIIHLPIWWLLTRNGKLRQSPIMVDYKSKGGFDTFKITKQYATSKIMLNQNIIFNDDIIKYDFSDDEGDDEKTVGSADESEDVSVIQNKANKYEYDSDSEDEGDDSDSESDIRAAERDFLDRIHKEKLKRRLKALETAKD